MKSLHAKNCPLKQTMRHAAPIVSIWFKFPYTLWASAFNLVLQLMSILGDNIYFLKVTAEIQ